MIDERAPNQSRKPPGVTVQLAAGCVATGFSAIATACFLFINGALVYALLQAARQSEFQWIKDVRVSQFLLFACPVLLTVMQWKLFDYMRLRGR